MSVAVAAGVVAFGAIATSLSEPPKPASSGHAGNRRGTTRSAATRRRRAPAAVVDPLTTRTARAWVGSRHGEITAAVLDLKNGREWVLHPGERAQTASIIKVDILETLLYQTEQQGRPLSDVETALARNMIEQSDDHDAQELWDTVGGASGIAAYDKKAGLSHTTPNPLGYWGKTTTSAADQIKVLKQLAQSSHLLTRKAQAYELDLMRHIASDQAWGVSGGVPARVSLALKNGWVPLTSATDWEINSLGWIKGGGRDYLVAVLTKNDPSEGYGITTIDRLSKEIYAALG